MNSSSINSTEEVNDFHPAIICTADLSLYLIGAQDKNGQFHHIYSQDMTQALYAPSLESAKQILKEHLGPDGIRQKVILEMRNPYDEMIGTESCGPTKMMISLTTEANI